MKRLEFLTLVQTILAQNPHWLSDCLAAASQGMQDALASAHERRATSDAAMLAALSLAQSARLTPETRNALNNTVCRAINPKNAAPIERKFLEQSK